ncbi:MAG: Fur family transcriptional regulator [Dehalococcoidia bacterium]
MPDTIPSDELLKRLSDHGLAASAQRVAMLEFILTMGPEHLGAEELHQRLKARFPTISRATIYNNLSALAEAGLIEKLDMPDGARFGSVPGPHVNLVCQQCGTIADVLIGDTSLEALMKRAAEAGGFEARAVSISISGRCRGCGAA